MDPIIRTLDDIRNATVIGKTDHGKLHITLDCGPDVQSMLAFGSLTPENWQGFQRSSINQESHRDSWTKTPSYEAAADLLRYGWPEGTAKATALQERITPRKITGMKHRTVYRGSVAPGMGAIVNVPAVVAGLPCQFTNARRTNEIKQGSKIVRVGVHMFYSSMVSANVIERRGASIMAFIRTLERFGRQIDLTIYYGGQTTGRGDHYGTLRWHAKRPGTVINPDQMAFALIHPSSFRRVGFAMAEHMPAPLNDNSSYFSPADLSRYWKAEVARHDLYVPTSSGDEPEWKSEDSAAAWVMDTLRKQGIDC